MALEAFWMRQFSTNNRLNLRGRSNRLSTDTLRRARPRRIAWRTELPVMTFGVSFHVRWKEELFCRCWGGSFILVLTGLGSESRVYFPNEDRWREVAPRWALNSWGIIHRKLRSWCEQNGIQLVVDDVSNVYPQ